MSDAAIFVGLLLAILLLFVRKTTLTKLLLLLRLLVKMQTARE